MNARRFASMLIKDGTKEEVNFNGKTVGYIGAKKRGSGTIFVWGQSELRMESDWRGDAYSMSVPLLEELEDRSVDTVYIADAESSVPLDEFHETDDNLIVADDERFEEEQDYDQRFVRVD